MVSENCPQAHFFEITECCHWGQRRPRKSDYSVSESAWVIACVHGEFPVPVLTCNLCHRHQRRAGNQMRPSCLVKSRHDSYCRLQRRRCCASEEDTRYTLKRYQMKTTPTDFSTLPSHTAGTNTHLCGISFIMLANQIVPDWVLILRLRTRGNESFKSKMHVICYASC